MSESSPLRMREALAALAILFALTLALHHRAFSGYFLVDDWVNIRQLEEPGQALRLFTGNWMFGERPPDPGRLYRPIPRLSFLLDRAIWGLDHPIGFHVTNLVLHALSVFFLWGIAWALWRRRLVAWAAAVIFLAHPLTVEPAQWISARTDLWAAVFSLPAIWLTLALAGERFSPHRLWSLLLMQLALCSKETAVVLPAVLLGIDLWRQRGWDRLRVLWWVATVLLWALHFLQRRWMFGEFLGYEMAERYLSHIPLALVSLRASELLINPFAPWPFWAWPISMALEAGVVCLVVWLITRGRSRGALGFVAVWWFVSLAPLAPLGFWLGENTRLLYPATAAAILLAVGILAELAGMAIRSQARAKAVFTTLVAFWVLPLAWTSHRVTADWANASRAARQIIEVVSEDLAANPPVEGSVVILEPPQRVGRAIMFRTYDLVLAVDQVLREQGVDSPPILAEIQIEPDHRATLDTLNTGAEFVFRLRGSDRPAQVAGSLYAFGHIDPEGEAPPPGRWVGVSVQRGLRGDPMTEIARVTEIPSPPEQ